MSESEGLGPKPFELLEPSLRGKVWAQNRLNCLSLLSKERSGPRTVSTPETATMRTVWTCSQVEPLAGFPLRKRFNRFKQCLGRWILGGEGEKGCTRFAPDLWGDLSSENGDKRFKGCKARPSCLTKSQLRNRTEVGPSRLKFHFHSGRAPESRTHRKYLRKLEKQFRIAFSTTTFYWKVYFNLDFSGGLPFSFCIYKEITL